VADTRTLQVKVGNLPGTGTVSQPPMADIRTSLPRHPDPTRRYPLRTVESLLQVIVHHTVTSTTATPQAIAQGQIDRRDLPGITYHFTVDGPGTISWTQPLETVTAQTSSTAANLGGIGVALIGSFNDAPPGEAQLNAAAQLIAWLLSTYRIGTDKVVGRSELENTSSPGRQWLQESRYKNTLMAKVAEIVPTP
jgi:N-acetyl-anhydromuramyl-L-alanine amidase AmpD